MLKFNNLTFESVINEWISIHSSVISESTYFNYVKVIKSVSEKIGGEKIKNINQAKIQSFFQELSAANYATNTIINCSKVVKQSLEFAEQRGYIKKSPYFNIKIPQKRKNSVLPFESWEVEKILKETMPDWARDAIEISFRTGMRKGEIFALKKEDINFEKMFLTVRHTQSLDKNGKTIIKHPKTRASKRRIDLDEHTVFILRRRCLESDSEFIFSRNGKMLVPYNISNIVKKCCKTTGITPKRFHDLRHGHATYLLINNVHPKIVQERLGHENIGITLDTYSHLIPGMQSAAVNAINELHL